jgi:hypothetical protein
MDVNRSLLSELRLVLMAGDVIVERVLTFVVSSQAVIEIVAICSFAKSLPRYFVYITLSFVLFPPLPDFNCIVKLKPLGVLEAIGLVSPLLMSTLEPEKDFEGSVSEDISAGGL